MMQSTLARHVFLIGYRCTGKTSVGRTLAGLLGCPFADSDVEIVRRAGRSIQDMVREEGWTAFRHLEREVIENLCRQPAQIIATGGGVVLDPRSVSVMQRVGTLIWLNARPETIRRRMAADGKTPANRPPLSGTDAAAETEAVLQARRPLYRTAADHVVDTDGREIAEIAAVIKTMLGPGTGSENECKRCR